MTVYHDAFMVGLRPPDPMPVSEWCCRHVEIGRDSPYPGKFSINNSRWIEAPLNDCAEIACRSVTIMASRQSAKSLLAELLVAWSVSEDPAPLLWVMSTGDEAKRLSREKLMPLLERCPPVAERMPTNRYHKSTYEIIFSTMPFWIVSAAGPNHAALSSKSMRRLVLDEVALYKAGAVNAVLKTVTAFWNYLVLAASTPDHEFDAIHRMFLSGNQCHWHFSCPDCAALNRLLWKQIKFTVFKHEDGAYNWPEIKKSVRFECSNCKKQFPETPAFRKHLCRAGKWVALNPTADPRHRSYTWNAILPEWISWSETLVPEFLEAKDALRAGYLEPLKNFITARLAEPFADRHEGEDNPFQSQQSAYNVSDKWEREKLRYLLVDVQKDHLWMLCRAFAEGGDSRWIAWEKLRDFDQLRERQQQLGITDKRVVVDSGYSAASVYAACKKYGWTAMKGEDFPYFVETDRKGNRLHTLWKLGSIDPNIGRAMQGQHSLKLILWSKPSVMDMLDRMMRGRADQRWELPATVPEDYLQFLNSYKRAPKLNSRGDTVWEWKYRKDKHALDCEQMALVCAIAEGLIQASTVVEPAPPASPDLSVSA